jgi:hypothetical protein
MEPFDTNAVVGAMTSSQGPPLPAPWRRTLDVARRLRQPIDLPEPHLWPYKGFARRAADLSFGMAALVMSGVWAEALILGRSIIELEILLKWFATADQEKRLNVYIQSIRKEEQRVARKIANGTSSAMQVLGDVLGPEVFARLAEGTATLGPAKDAGAKNLSFENVRERAKIVDLEWNYDSAYWMASIFAHIHPLSVIESHPPDWEHTLCRMFACGGEDPMPRSLAIVALPASALHVFTLLDQTLHLELERPIEQAWAAVHQFVRDEVAGIRWKTSPDVPPGEVHVHMADGTVKVYSPGHT